MAVTATHPGGLRKTTESDSFTLLELMVVIGIIALMLVAVAPAVTSLSKANGQKAAVSALMNALEQARALALTSRSPTYVVFADQTTPETHRCRAFIVFQDDKDFAQLPVSKWNFLPTGISMRPDNGLLAQPTGSFAITFACPGGVGSRALPYVKFDANGMVAAPDSPLVIDLFAGSVSGDAGSGVMSYTNAAQKSAQKFDAIVLARFTGRARYVDPYSG